MNTNIRRRRRKRTAGQRRYNALSSRVSEVRMILRGLQNGMVLADRGGKELGKVYVMQRLTEAYEQLGIREL